MTSVLLLLMTVLALFGGWVWTLKQEMRVLKRRMAPPEQEEPAPTRAIIAGPAGDRVHSINHRIELKPAAIAVSGNGVRVKRGNDGVQTFVIDA